MRKLAHSSLSLVLIHSFLISGVGCRSTTTLISTDPEAEIRVENAKEKGQLGWADTHSMFRPIRAQVEKPGCAPQSYTISRMDEFDPGGFLLGFVTYGVGFLWAGKYRPSYELVYRCEPASAREGSRK